MTQELAARIPNLTIANIKELFCPLATDQEAYFFLRLCQSQGLNPFLRDAHLIKYSKDDPAQAVTGKDAFTKRAEDHPQFAGFEAGVIVEKDGQEIQRPGAFVRPQEKLTGGWARVYRHDRTIPFYNEVGFKEYDKSRNTWKDIPATMIRKVALVQALREAFPNALRGLYDASEMDIDAELPEQPVAMPATAGWLPTEETPRPLHDAIVRRFGHKANLGTILAWLQLNIRPDVSLLTLTDEEKEQAISMMGKGI